MRTAIVRSNYICTTCRFTLIHQQPRPATKPNRPNPPSRSLPRRHESTQSQTRHPIAVPTQQPLDAYYADLLAQPLPLANPAQPSPQSKKEETLAKARVVFGSRLAGPAERRAAIDEKSTMIAGIMVPARPKEPDNCCMSGCVNCVWDVYRDDVEEWAGRNREAQMRLRAREVEGMSGKVVGDDRGGGSESDWAGGGTDDGMASQGEWSDEGIFENIPVGIREFMRQEKRLKERHRQEGTLGG